MTTVAPAPAPAAAPAPPARPRRPRRWHRWVIPLGAVALFWLIAYVAHAVEQPTLSDPGTLSPQGVGGHGSSRLAQLLQAQGVPVIRVGTSVEALAAAQDGDATIFVPTPDNLDGRLMPELAKLSGNYRVVIVRPGPLGQFLTYLPTVVDPVRSRWATQVVAPGCSADYAVRAGAAAVHRDVYVVDAELAVQPTQVCYDHSLVEYQLANRVQAIWVGATEPFRDDRIDEVGNAALATGLLSAHGRVIWIDLHISELQVPGAAPPPDLPDYDRGDQDRTNIRDPLLAALPLTIAVLLAAVAVAYALARARRLGPPVAEPLPVLVPAAEVVLGRGRLYRRIRARTASIQRLRAAALVQLARLVDPLDPGLERAVGTPGPAQGRLIGAVAQRAGLDPAVVATVLFAPVANDDNSLVQAVAALDHLVSAVRAGPPPTANPQPPNQPQPTDHPRPDNPQSGGAP